MKKVLLLFLIAAIAFIACKSLGEEQQPSFIMWCDTCVQDTSWVIYDDYFKCFSCGTLW